jgi:hypothetical protein
MIRMVAKVLQKSYILIIISTFETLLFIGIILFVSVVTPDYFYFDLSFVAIRADNMLTSFVNATFMRPGRLFCRLSSVDPFRFSFQ